MAKSLHSQRYRTLPAFLREMREQAGLTQRELAKKLRMDHALIHKSESRERRVDLAEFVDWSKACGLDPIEAVRDFLRRLG